MAERKVVVLEPDQGRAQAWETVLHFLDCEVRVVVEPAALEWPAPEALEWTAIVVGEQWPRSALAKLASRARAYPAPLPILVAGALPPGIVADGTQWLALDTPVRLRELAVALDRAAEVRARPHDVPPLLSSFRPSGASRAIRAVHRLVEQVAPFDTNVLVLGESGTGKEMVARHIHELSPRSARPFVPVNCGAIPAELLESELFGHEKGAFTGALSARQGRFELAEGGTLFLDEIGDMSLHMQVKLLRVLQERTFERVGGTKTFRADVRIIAATHRDLDAAIVAGAFREDLYYRLNVFPIVMPRLADRMEDLPSLAEQLLDRIERFTGRRIELTARALDALGGYGWPGNVRELANLLERLVILNPGRRVCVADLPERYRPAAPNVTRLGPLAEPGALPDHGFDLKDHLTQLERRYIREALARADGTVAGAARLLGMQRTTLVEKLRKYRLAAADVA
ncbi:MAG: sigma-54 dependent transcriptional regulator [Steroidobacteraceae bacterium]|nr:sigma-54 dependent transcriptional regulator [Steroidobacteraceae bacterium]